MPYLRQSTEQIIKFGPMVDQGDAKTPEAGLATAMDNATTGLRVSKDGGNYLDRDSGTVPAYDELGEYNVTLSVTDTSAVGELKIIFEEGATCLPHWQRYMVVSANFYDAMTGANRLEVDTKEINSSVISGTGVGDKFTA